jgi:hypothetical protein
MIEVSCLKDLNAAELFLSFRLGAVHLPGCAGSSFFSSSSSCSGSSSAWRRDGCAPSLGRRMLPMPDRPPPWYPISSDRLRRLARKIESPGHPAEHL